MLAVLFIGAVLAYVAWTIACLEANVRKAKAIKVPVVRLPIDSNNVLWILLQPQVWKILDALPIEWSSYPRFVRFSRRGWYFAERATIHEQIGPVWALVSPVAINIHFADPDTIHDIVTRRGDFQRPIAELKLLELYGPCISTAKWEEWPRHRKVMATPFNETIMKSVWDESLRQAKGMLRSWVTASTDGIASYQKDTRALSLNVLAATGFGKSYDFRGSTEPQIDDEGGYRDALQTVLDNIILLMLVPFNVLCKMPKSWARIGNAGISFQKHMVKLLEEETKALAQGQPGSGAIMPSFVRAADIHRHESTAGSPYKVTKKGLSVDEIFGNLFVINFAGHDTTANTLAFGMLLLGAHPEVQAWLAEEISIVTGDSLVESWDYKELYPKLKRCRAVFYEVLRLYPPVPALPSIASNHTQELKISTQTLHIPKGVNLTVNLRAMQVDPAYWPDANSWLPSRWISNPAPPKSPTAIQLASEELIIPSKSIFFPWGEGPQICPGKKFAEVQAVAVLACLFNMHRLAIKKQPGESEEAAVKRATECSNDVDLEMLVRLRDADRVHLVANEA
ncbi:cytochrome P450 [Xylaria bambusicola]|uniref:cytochrome P450 n=1 Tax=Xylaria bambusicola TaxID=326684 RepID=UPI002007898D|nr:cytochrome P450 [Xylaria bambusicola]KAI0513196.1 cytochrome P450 [Xylaria bambusicola]